MMKHTSNNIETKKRILVVDDEPSIGKFLDIKLRLSGYEVIITISGIMAIELVKTQRPDIMLLDIVMPDVTGIEVLERVRSFSQIPIIVFTGRSDVAQLAVKLGANDYIAKPFNPDALLQKINFLLNPQQNEEGI